MNEWPENLSDLELNWNWIESANKVLQTLVILLIVAAGIQYAQASELPTVIVAETSNLLDFSTWFTDGAVGGFDAAGVSAGGW